MMKRNRILYLTLFFLSFVFVYFYGGKVPYTLFFVVLLLPLLSLLHTAYIFLRFKYTQEIDKKFVTKGEKVKFIFSVCNEDLLLYPYLNVAFYGAKNIFSRQFQSKNFSLLPLKDKSFSFELECRYRGVYDVGIEYVDIHDLLGLFSLRYKVFEPKYVTVHPRIVKLDRFHISTNFISDSQTLQNNRYEDMTTVSDIRDYAYGDSFKRVHWKLTSKLNRLMVKNFQNTSETNATLILDLQRNRYSFEENTIIEDKVIESALAVMYYCLNNWLSTSLVFFKETIVHLEAKNPLDFDEAYRVLSGLKFQETIGLKEILDIYLGESIYQNNLFIFTPHMDYELYNQLYKARLLGNEISIIYSSPEEITGIKDQDAANILDSLPEMGIRVYKLNISDDVKLVLER